MAVVQSTTEKRRLIRSLTCIVKCEVMTRSWLIRTQSGGPQGPEKFRPLLWLLLAVLAVPSIGEGLWAQGLGSRHYFYLSDKRIVTLELIDERSVILNYINLADTIEFVRAPEVLVVESAGTIHVGHVIEVEGAEDPSKKFKVSELVKPREFKGYTILGRFLFKTPPTQAYLRVGSKIVEFEPLSEEQFESVASRIGELEMGMEDTRVMLRFVGFTRGFGKLHKVGSPESERLAPLFPDLDLIAPVILADPAPTLPESERGRRDPVIVQLTAGVGLSGGIFNITVKEGINSKLDQLAMDFVRNSWRMLPAISKGKIANSEAVLNVRFRR